MNKLLIFLFSMLAVSLEAAVITNWGAQFPTAVPGGTDIILMQKGGVTYYFTPNQLAANIATNAIAGGILNKIGNLNGIGTNTRFYGIVTGATVRATNVHDISDVKFWGAVGDGVTDDTDALEAAIAAADEGGWVVYVSPGKYLIKRTLYLPSNACLRGAGFESRITKPTSVKVFLTNATYATGGFSVALNNTSGFTVGGAIFLTDVDSPDWLATVATITNITGSTVTFNRPINDTLETNNGSYATTSFPLICNEQDSTTNIVIRNLTLDGNGATGVDPRESFVLATIHFAGNFGGLVDNVWLLNSPCDAYSDQGTNGLGLTVGTNMIRRTANTIRNSRISHAGRHGVHLGTCMEGAMVAGNDIKYCGQFAEFYCAFATYTTSVGNLVDRCLSGFAGIDQRDFGNTISGNVIQGCTNYSIDLISSGGDGTGGRVTIANNIISGVGIIIDQPDCTVSGNTIRTASTKTGLETSGFADRLLLSGNVFISLGGSGSQAIFLRENDDCRVIGNTLRGAETLAYIWGCSQMVASGNDLSSFSGYAWRFEGSASTNCVIKDERNGAANPVVENTAGVRLVYEGYGNNGNTNPAVAGDWNAATSKMFNGTLVRWTNSTSTNLSVFTDNRWLRVWASGGEIDQGNIVISHTAPNITGTNSLNLLAGGQGRVRLWSGGVEYFRVNEFGNTIVGPPGSAAAGRLSVVNSLATTPAATIKAASAQVANLQDWVDSSLVTMSSVSSNGSFGIMTATPLAPLHVVGGIIQTNGGIWQTWSLGAPSAPATQGAVYWNDGTNICAVFMNAAGALSTNKLSMAAWP